MRTIILICLLTSAFHASQAQLRYTQDASQAPEIATVETYFQAYDDHDWETLSSLYAAGAVNHHNGEAFTSDALIASWQKEVTAYAQHHIELDAETERVITDQGETWVNAWGQWTGSMQLTDEQVSFPFHATFQFQQGKIVKAEFFYNASPLAAAFERAYARSYPIHLIKLWTATDAWRAMPENARRAYLTKLQATLQDLLDRGVQVVSWGLNEADTDQRMNCDFYAVWRFPSAALKHEFEAAIRTTGWHTYFRQQNAAGKNLGVETVMENLIRL